MEQTSVHLECRGTRSPRVGEEAGTRGCPLYRCSFFVRVLGLEGRNGSALAIAKPGEEHI
jgi:hypothetical protein